MIFVETDNRDLTEMLNTREAEVEALRRELADAKRAIEKLREEIGAQILTSA